MIGGTGRSRTDRRVAFLACLVTVGTVGLGAASTRAAAAPVTADQWVTAWAASPVESAQSGLVDATERMVVQAVFPGKRLRVRLSNAVGTVPVTVDDVFVGRSGGGASVAAGTSRHVTFSGRSVVTIPAGSEVWSDPVRLRLAAPEAVVISLYAADAPTVTRVDDSTDAPSFLAAGSDHAGDLSGTAFSPGDGWLVADGVAVTGDGGAGAVVALGDSITAGYQKQPTPNLSWPSLLAARLLVGPPPCRMSVINEGITGNHLTSGSPTGGFGGPSALLRADRDAFSQPGARAVIVLVGINDIGAGDATVPQLIAAYQQLITAAHAHRLRIVAGTLTPAGDPAQGSPYHELYGGGPQVQERVAVNQWIRSSGAFDGVIDFAGALADPRDANRLASPYDSGDHLHPSNAGYQRMADSVSRSLLDPCP